MFCWCHRNLFEFYIAVVVIVGDAIDVEDSILCSVTEAGILSSVIVQYLPGVVIVGGHTIVFVMNILVLWLSRGSMGRNFSLLENEMQYCGVIALVKKFRLSMLFTLS